MAPILRFVLAISFAASAIKAFGQKESIIQYNSSGANIGRDLNQYYYITKKYSKESDRELIMLSYLLVESIHNDNCNSQPLWYSAENLNTYFERSLTDDEYFRAKRANFSKQFTDTRRLRDSICRIHQTESIASKYAELKQAAYIHALDKFSSEPDPISAINEVKYIQSVFADFNLHRDTSLQNIAFQKSGQLYLTLCTRISNSSSSIETDLLVNLLDSIKAYYGDPIRAEIDSKLFIMMKERYFIYEKYLGELLLEGYKSFLQIKHRLPRQLSNRQTMEIYKYVIAVSQNDYLIQNIFFSQLRLFQISILSCQDGTTRPLMAGWNWVSSHIKRMPSRTLVANLSILIQQSQLSDVPLKFSEQYFEDRALFIKSFIYTTNLLFGKSLFSKIDSRIIYYNQHFTYEGCSVLGLASILNDITFTAY